MADYLRDATKRVDYISREAALDFCIPTYDLNISAQDQGILGDRFVEFLESIHAADVVEVVRCKDCLDYNTTGYDDAPGFGWCECLRREVQDCFYCAHGEREDYQCKE